ncbi:hypothetical protein QUF98_14850 [Bacillus mycoides]|nr:hypothetical protein [Bacillus mycoides]MDM5428296.1 hypothetical protein [Bacillus mycoides]
MHEKFDSKMKIALSEEKMKDLIPVIEKAVFCFNQIMVIRASMNT